MNILLTGGTGYIGSHAAVALINNGHRVILFDNLINSDKGVLNAINEITNKETNFVEGDLLDSGSITETLINEKIDSVIHFAGLKSVEESVKNPIRYFKNNVNGTVNLLEAMNMAGIYNLIFSGSATVYGNPQYLPIDESHPLNAINPYGRTKQQIEEILKATAFSNPQWRIVTLRYFNPIGAHPSGLIGEKIDGTPNHLMPLICKVALHELNELLVFGNDYETIDGTGVRDYIDINDLIDGHIAALEFIQVDQKQGIILEDGDLENYHSFNLGTGKGFSVLELIDAFESVSGIKIQYKHHDRRSGDIAELYAKTIKAENMLGWKSKRSIHDMCKSSWNFIKN